MRKTAKEIKAKTPTVTVRRTIEASAEELFDAWLDPDAIAQWMRPNGIDSTTAIVDARVGGAYEITMHRSAGPLLTRGVYVEIKRPSRLVLTWGGADSSERTSLVTVELHPRGRLTEIVVTHEQLPSDELVAPVNAGWSQALERLVDLFREERT